MNTRLKNYLKPFFNWKFLVCFLIPWFITNGIWYAMLYVGIRWHIVWLRNIASGYIAWLYTPIACEKIIIIPIALWLCKRLFKSDEKTMNDLNNMYSQAKQDLKKIFKIKKPKKIQRNKRRKIINERY